MLCSFDELCEIDEELQEWMEKWKTIGENEKLNHLQAFFRMVLTDQLSCYYYSFCRDVFIVENNSWHCIRCGECMHWREWHCGACDKCKDWILLKT